MDKTNQVSMASAICLLLSLAFSFQPAHAESQPDIMKRLEVEETLNVPYVTTQLDQVMDTSHSLDIYKPAHTDSPLPVILYLHAGGWAFGDKKDVNLMPHFFATNGFAFLSVNYRLRWDYRVYDQIMDVLAAIQWVRAEGKEHGLDSSRIILMGSGSGGHLASLTISDHRFLRAEGMDTAGIRAIVSLDSISYDIPRLMRELGSFLQRQQHELIFGDKESVWAAASPITHVKHGSPPFALLHDPSNEAATLQARAFAKKLSGNNVPVIIIPGEQDSENSIEQQLGRKNSIATGALMAFLRSQI